MKIPISTHVLLIVIPILLLAGSILFFALRRRHEP